MKKARSSSSHKNTNKSEAQNNESKYVEDKIENRENRRRSSRPNKTTTENQEKIDDFPKQKERIVKARHRNQNPADEQPAENSSSKSRSTERSSKGHSHRSTSNNSSKPKKTQPKDDSVRSTKSEKRNAEKSSEKSSEKSGTSRSSGRRRTRNVEREKFLSDIDITDDNEICITPRARLLALREKHKNKNKNAKRAINNAEKRGNREPRFTLRPLANSPHVQQKDENDKVDKRNESNKIDTSEDVLIDSPSEGAENSSSQPKVIKSIEASYSDKNSPKKSPVNSPKKSPKFSNEQNSQEKRIMIDLSSGNYSSSRKSTNSPILKKPSPRKPVDGILKESSSNQNEPNTKQISVNFDSSSLKYHKSSHNSKDKKSPYNNTAQLSNIDFDTILAAPNTSSGIHNDIDFKTVDLDFEETENAQENGKKNANDKKTKKNKDPKTADLGFETVDLEFERVESYSSQSGSEVEEEHEHKSKSTNKLTQQNPPISNKIENDEKSYTYEYETIGVEDDYSNDSTHTYTYVSEYIEYSSAPTSETEYEYVEEEEEEEEIPEKVDTRNLKLKSSNIKQQNTTITKVSSPSKQQQILQQYQIQKQQVQNPTRQFTFVSSANDANISIAPFYQNNNTVKYADKETLKKKSPHRTVSREPRQIQNSHQNLSGSFSSFDVGPSRALQEMQREMAKYVNLPRSVAHPSYNLPTERAAVIDDSGKMTEITKMLAQPPPEKFIKRWMDQDDADFTLESESIFTESIRSEVEEEEENAESVNNESKVQSSASYTYVIEEEEDEENEPENEEEEEKKENSTPSTTMKSFTELFDDMSTSSSQKPVQKVQKQYSSATIFSSEVSRNVEIENEVSENSSTLAENQNEEKEEELVTQDIECSQSDQIIEIIEEEEAHESFHSDVQHETQEEQQSKPESSQNSSILEKTSDISSLAESKPEKHESETQHQESDVDNESNKNSTIESSGKASNQNENEQENLNESATTDKDYSSTLHEESNDYDEEEEEEEDFLEKNRTSGIRSTLFPPLKLNFKKQHSSSDNSEEGSSFDSLDDSTSTKTNPISSLRVCIVELQFPTAISCRVSLSLRGDTDTVETNDCDPSIQPRFNEKYNVPIEDANHDELSIRVISNNKSIAQAFIPTNIFPLETFVDKWFDLTPVGRIRLTVRSSADESDNEGYSDDPSTASLNFSHNESDLFSEEGNLASLAAKYNSPRGMIYNLNTNENNSNIEANEVQKNENNSIFNSSSSSSSSSSLAGKESDKNEQEPNVAQNNQVVPEIDSDDDSADSYEEKSFDTDPIVLSQQIEIEEEEEIAEIMNLPSPSLKTQNKSDIQVANLKDALQSSSLNLSDYQNDSDSSSFQFDEHNLENYMKKNG